MRPWLRRVCACALVALTACPGNGEAARAPAATPSGSAPAASAAKKARARALPPVTLATGTDSIEGVLLSSCVKDKCDRYPGATPKRFIEAAWQGVLVFAIAEIPTRARIEIRNQDGTVIEEAPLQPRATMSYRHALKKGSYTVTLVSEWKDRSGSWLFGLKVPITQT